MIIKTAPHPYFPAQEVSVVRGTVHVSISVRDPQTNTGPAIILTPDQAKDLANELLCLVDKEN